MTTTADSGAGSLREAITLANATTDPDVVEFNLAGAGPFTIALQSGLPFISSPLTIDGKSQPGYLDRPRVELNGAAAGNDQFGLWLVTSNCVVRGLAINRFTGGNGDGIRLESFGGHVIQGNFIGTGVNGTNALGNQGQGILVMASDNLIGGNDPTNRNLISGNQRTGIYLFNGIGRRNTVAGNFIGTDITGTKRLGNLENGVSFSGSSSNLIGGTTPEARNVISGNGLAGVYFINNSRGNVVNGNYIGTDFTGSMAVSNTAAGVVVADSADNLIGGSTFGAGNLISGNGGRGVLISGSASTGTRVQGNLIGTSASGMARLGNGFTGVEVFDAANNVIGGTAAGAGNVISANGLSGVKLGDVSARLNRVEGNLIGVDATGTNSLGNVANGVTITGVSNNIVGGDVAGARNVISGNMQNGVYIAMNGAVGNVVAANFIGTDLTGRKRIGNVLSGVRVESPRNTIGGLSAPAGNVVSGNSNNGAIYMAGTTASNNVVAGNFVGVDVTGTNALANSSVGIFLTNAPANTIGGASAGARNVISGNQRNAIFILGNSARANVIQGNYIGPDASGTRALPNGTALPLMDGAGGIDIAGAPFNVIGGSAPGAGNVISGNLRDGIAIGDAGATNTVIQGNFIGTTADGLSPLGNEWHGIEIRTAGGGANTLIGGSDAASENRIAYAQSADYDGVRVRAGTGNTGIMIHRNSFFSNGSSGLGLGIDLGNNGPDSNDACDADGGANQSQNYPTLLAAFSGNGTTVRGIVRSTANSSFRVQFYWNPTPDSSGYGEGQSWLGEAIVNTGANCTSAVFTVTFPGVVPAGEHVSATATDSANNTSEISPNVQVVAQPQLTLAPAGTPGQAQLSWPSNVFPFGLEQTTNLAPPVVWTPATNLPAFANGEFAVTIEPGGGSRFYRLNLQ